MIASTPGTDPARLSVMVRVMVRVNMQVGMITSPLAQWLPRALGLTSCSEDHDDDFETMPGQAG